jgi:tyrosyl-tRNA synthetase
MSVHLRNATAVPAQEAGRFDEGPLRIKFGVEPTGQQLHLGHMVLLRKLRELQDAGHTAVVIVGDATARVGDPSGRSKERPPLSPEQIEANTLRLIEQLERVLDTTQRFELHRNSAWLNMPSFELFEILGKATLSQILQREDIRQRVDKELPVSVLESIYPLLQGFDSVAIKADVELGGRDQLINLMTGRELQRDRGMRPQLTVMMDLLVGTDGVDKMSKSIGNHIPIEASPEDAFGLTMKVPDEAVDEWGHLLSIEIDPQASLRDRKWQLAKGVVAILHDGAAAEWAANDFHQRFVARVVPDEMETLVVAEATPFPAAVADAVGVSRSQARRLMESKAVKLDGEPITDVQAICPREGVLQVGKRFRRLAAA